MFQQVQGFCLVQDALMNLLSRDEVSPRSNLSLSFAGTALDPLAEIQSLKGLKPGAVLRLVEGNHHCFFNSSLGLLKATILNVRILNCDDVFFMFNFQVEYCSKHFQPL